MPRNEDAKFQRGFVVNGSPLVIDVPSVEVSGDIRLNGQSPPGSAFENARLSLAVTDSPDRVLPGTDTLWRLQTPRGAGALRRGVRAPRRGGMMPVNTRATLVRGWRVAAQPNRTIDIPVGTYEGAFFLNGESFPGSDVESGRTRRVAPRRGRSGRWTWAVDHVGAFSRRLLPGLYRAAYTHVVGALRRAVTTCSRP